MLSPSKVVNTSESALKMVRRFSAMYPAPPQASRHSWMVSVAWAVAATFTAAARDSVSRCLRSCSSVGLATSHSPRLMAEVWSCRRSIIWFCSMASA